MSIEDLKKVTATLARLPKAAVEGIMPKPKRGKKKTD
jgi:hypothetical protein